MKVAYTNISPITNAYTNINHFFYIKNKLKPNKLFVCIWDLFVYEDKRLYSLFPKDAKKEVLLRNNIQAIEHILKYLDIDYKIIYLSDVWVRFFKNNRFSYLFQKILSKITYGDILNKKFRYLPIQEYTLSKFNYIIIDYINALLLNELFPELAATPPTHYICAEHLTLFLEDINQIVREIIKQIPQLHLIKNVPVIMDPQTGLIPSCEMSQLEIVNIIDRYFSNKKITNKEIYDIVEVLNPVLHGRFLGDIRKSKSVSKDVFYQVITKIKKEEAIMLLALNFYLYFTKIKSIIMQKEISKQAPSSLFINDHLEFKKRVKPLNLLKFAILQHCNGKNSSLDISRRTSLPVSTVSTYLTKLKQAGLITPEKKPKLTFSNIVITLSALGGENEEDNIR